MTSRRSVSLWFSATSAGVIAAVAVADVTYGYDKLHRLKQAMYDNGSAIAFE